MKIPLPPHCSAASDAWLVVRQQRKSLALVLMARATGRHAGKTALADPPLHGQSTDATVRRGRRMDPSLTILMAEDDENDALLMQRAFKAIGLMRPPQIVHDGRDAIDYLLGHGSFADRVIHPNPHFLILDLKMPRVSGFEVLEFLQRHPELVVIPTVVWSSSADVRDVKRAYCLGANGYLQKPHTFDELQAMLMDLVKYWSRCLVPSVEGDSSCEELRNLRPFAGSHH